MSTVKQWDRAYDRAWEDCAADVIASRVNAGRVLGRELAAVLPANLTLEEFLCRREVMGFRDNFIMCTEAYYAYRAANRKKETP